MSPEEYDRSQFPEEPKSSLFKVIQAALRICAELGVFLILSFLLTIFSEQIREFLPTNDLFFGLSLGLIFIVLPWLTYGFVRRVKRDRLHFLIRWSLPMMLAIFMMPVGPLLIVEKRHARGACNFFKLREFYPS